jgi:hypothetical protein
VRAARGAELQSPQLHAEAKELKGQIVDV